MATKKVVSLTLGQRAVLVKALRAFWSEVEKAHPDLPARAVSATDPVDEHQLQTAAEDALAGWLVANDPVSGLSGPGGLLAPSLASVRIRQAEAAFAARGFCLGDGTVVFISAMAGWHGSEDVLRRSFTYYESIADIGNLSPKTGWFAITFKAASAEVLGTKAALWL